MSAASNVCGEKLAFVEPPTHASQEKNAFEYTYKLSEDPPLLSATITDLCNEPLFFSTYQSDEEDISSSEGDNMSVCTATSDSIRGEGTNRFADFDADIFEDFEAMLAEDFGLSPQCNEARAVMLFSGRPKMVQVRKSSIPSTPFPFPTKFSHGRSIPALSVSSTSLQSSSACSSASSMSSLSSDCPSTPLLETGLQTPISVYTPSTPRTSKSLFFDRSGSPTPSRPSTTKAGVDLRKRNPFGLTLRKRSIPDFSSVPTTAPPAPLTAPLLAPPSYRPKLDNRSATNPRMPTFDLPPFPEDQASEEPMIKPARPWALRKDSFGPISGSSNKNDSKADLKTESVPQRLRRVKSGMGWNKR